MRRVSVVLTVALCFSSLSAVDAVGSDERWAVCGKWRDVPVPAEPEASWPGGAGYVTDVEVISPTEAWAISDEGYEIWNEAHVYRWGGMRWEEVPFPAPESGFKNVAHWVLTSIEAVTPTELWVAGYKLMLPDNILRPIFGRWDGARWRLVPARLWDVHGWIGGLTRVPGTHRLIAVGAWSPARKPQPSKPDDMAALVLRWNGKAWHRMPTPEPGEWSQFADVVAAGSSVWAVGTAHRSGEADRLLASKLTADGWKTRWGPRGGIASADAASADEIWAAGTTRQASGQEALIARWDGRDWKAVRHFDRVGSFTDVVVPAPGQVWAVGEGIDPRAVIVRRVAAEWRIDWRSDEPGRVTAIGGTPHNLWAFLTYPPVEYAEVWRFTSLHRC